MAVNVSLSPAQAGNPTKKKKNGGGFQTVGFPNLDLSSLFVLFCPFWDFPDFSGIFPICSGMVRGFSRFVLFLFLGLLRAPTRNSPERVCDTIWTFPEKSGKHPGLETPRFSFSQFKAQLREPFLGILILLFSLSFNLFIFFRFFFSIVFLFFF